MPARTTIIPVKCPFCGNDHEEYLTDSDIASRPEILHYLAHRMNAKSYCYRWCFSCLRENAMRVEERRAQRVKHLPLEDRPAEDTRARGWWIFARNRTPV